MRATRKSYPHYLVLSRKFFTFKNKRHLPTWLAVVLSWFLRLVGMTYRVKFDDPHGVLDKLLSGSKFVIALWHNRILFAPVLIPRKYLTHTAVLISASRDGEYIATLVRQFGLKAVRGSSSRGATAALLGLRHQLEECISPILTVDGPRGPRYSIHSGAVALAQMTQTPIVPLALNSRHYWSLKSWDKLQIPWPFTRVTIRFGAPLAIAENTAIDDANAQLRAAMLDITADKD